MNPELYWWLVYCAKQDHNYVSIRGYNLYIHPQHVILPLKPTAADDKYLVKVEWQWLRSSEQK